MLAITLLFFLMLVLIFWSYCGYLILLLILSARNQIKRTSVSLTIKKTTKQLKMAVIIPCYNEADYVRRKIDNLKKLTYDSDKLEVLFVDGCSTDATDEIIVAAIADLPNWHIVDSNRIGKINQINYALSILRKDIQIVVNTDMDAILSPDILIEINKAFQSDEKIAVVGANILPENSIPLEEKYWFAQSILRLLESNAYTASIVVAPCYAFRRSFIGQLPDDCVADDIYMAFKANTEGYLTKCVETARGVEVRTPNSFDAFVRHKYRKGNAYLVELLRFFNKMPQMASVWKIMYITKLVQLIITPWVVPFFLLTGGFLAFYGGYFLKLVVADFGFLFFAYLLTVILMQKGQKNFTIENNHKRPFSPMFVLINNIILMAVGFKYPFYRQTSCYNRLENNCVEK